MRSGCAGGFVGRSGTPSSNVEQNETLSKNVGRSGTPSYRLVCTHVWMALIGCILAPGCTPRGAAPTAAAPSDSAGDVSPTITAVSPGVTAVCAAVPASAPSETNDPPASREPASPAGDEPDRRGIDHDDVDLSGLDFSDLSLDDLEPEEDNPLAGCTICHVDVGDEYAASKHHREEILCTDCHGPSEGHAADENNAVKPDEVFFRADVDRLCGECHDCKRPGAAKAPDPVPADWKVCTACHGSHELIPTAE